MIFNFVFIILLSIKNAENKENFVTLYIFLSERQNASQTQRKMCAVYGKDIVDDSKCHKWFRKFRVNNFSLSDAKRIDKFFEASTQHY